MSVHPAAAKICAARRTATAEDDLSPRGPAEDQQQEGEEAH